jgi:hypothetical protein
MSVPSNEKEITRQIALPDDVLLERIGADLQGIQAFPMSRSQLILNAQKWIEAQLPRIRQTLCGNLQVRQFADGDELNAELIIAVASLLASIYASIDPIALSVIIARRGLKSLCHSSWSET